MERNEQQKKQPRKHSAAGRIALATALVFFALFLILGGWLYSIYMEGKSNLSNTVRETPEPDEPDISPSEMVEVSPEDLGADESLPSDWNNILLLGSDSRNGKSYGRSDATIIASVNTKTGEVKLTSLMRDIWIEIPRKGKGKLNSALAYGGPTLAMKTINEAFSMNISSYIFVDFVGFPYIIDQIGGITLDIEKKEVRYLNETIGDLNKKNYPKGTDFSLLEEYGESTKLTGIQALAYARIRHADSDFERTQRQRNVLMAIFKKVKSQGVSLNLAGSAAAILPSVETNMSLSELLKISGKIIASDLDTLKELRIPIDGSYKSGTYNGTYSIRPDFEENTAALHEFIYGEK